MNFQNKVDELNSLSNKNILITGAGGMLGTAFKETLNLYIPSVNIFAFNKNELNVLDKERILECKNLNPDFIINCAGLVNADYCEDNKVVAFNIIVNGMKNIIDLAKLTGAKVFFNYCHSYLNFFRKSANTFST